jgi:hypothetical protein
MAKSQFWANLRDFWSETQKKKIGQTGAQTLARAAGIWPSVRDYRMQQAMANSANIQGGLTPRVDGKIFSEQAFSIFSQIRILA